MSQPVGGSPGRRNWEILYNIHGEGVVGARMIVTAPAPDIARKAFMSMHNNNPNVKIQSILMV